ncbi:MAG: hypothetical protein IPK93_11530 [Solirubrobacterales bacterium]|nr:hypothetical protein [Solirubrobacterales bacterium]
MPSVVLTARSMPGTVAAIREAHFPRSEESSAVAMHRLAYEELFLHQAVLRRGRVELSQNGPPAISGWRVKLNPGLGRTPAVPADR